MTIAARAARRNAAKSGSGGRHWSRLERRWPSSVTRRVPALMTLDCLSLLRPCCSIIVVLPSTLQRCLVVSGCHHKTLRIEYATYPLMYFLNNVRPNLERLVAIDLLPPACERDRSRPYRYNRRNQLDMAYESAGFVRRGGPLVNGREHIAGHSILPVQRVKHQQDIRRTLSLRLRS